MSSLGQLEKQIEAIVIARVQGYITQQLDRLQTTCDMNLFEKKLAHLMKQFYQQMEERTADIKKLVEDIEISTEKDIRAIKFLLQNKKVMKELSKIIDKLDKKSKTEKALHWDS